MREQLHLIIPAVAGAVMAVVLWVALALRLQAVGKSRWRPAMLCLPALLIAIGYGVYWLAFFSSVDMAVQLHAIRLTISHFAGLYLGSALPWIGGTWLAVGLGLLLPAFRSREP
jgi:hypothetical protein